MINSKKRFSYEEEPDAVFELEDVQEMVLRSNPEIELPDPFEEILGG